MNEKELFEFIKDRISIRVEIEEWSEGWTRKGIKVTSSLLMRNPETNKEEVISTDSSKTVF